MGAKEDIEERLTAKTLSKIHGQPTDQSVTLLRKEVAKIAANVPTSLGGGKHGHLGLVLEPAKYTAISHGGATFEVPTHPGAYPSTVSATAEARAREEAEHKAKIREFEIYAGVNNAIKDLIIEAVDEEWLEEIEDDVLGFTNVTVQAMIKHLEDRGGTLDYFETQEIKMKRDAPWDGEENVVTYFSRVEKARKQLERANIATSDNELINQALFTFKQSGELEQGLVNWDAKAGADKTWTELKKHFTKEYADRRKHALIESKSAGYGSAGNVAEEDTALEIAALTAEVIKQVRSESDSELKKILEQQCNLIEANKSLMSNLMSQLANNGTGTGRGGGGGGGGDTKDIGRKKCPICNFGFHNEKNCWELEANKDKRPANWVSRKKE